MGRGPGKAGRRRAGLTQAERDRRRADRRAGRLAGQAPLPEPPAALPSTACALYRDIEIAPPTAFRLQSVLVNGGPLWPDFDRQPIVRLQRRGRWVDAPAEPLAGPRERIAAPCLWGGYAIAHFGHLVADHLTRVLAANAARPDDVFLFLSRPGGSAEDAPGYFWEVLAWYGVTRDRVRFVDRPMVAAELRCFAQAEPFASHGPDAGYLDLLDRNAALRGLQPRPAELVYVGRPGLLAEGKGGAAGESYLIGLLRGQGIRVLDPARESLGEQLAAYAGARNLIFAEGSAVHGRQLLGRLDQRIEILNRRRGARLAQAALAPRCTALTHVEATSATIGMGTLAARRHSALGLSIYDRLQLFAAFERCGFSLADHWDDAVYEQAVTADAEAWLEGVARHGTALRFDLDEARLALRAQGVEVAAPEAW